KQRLHDTPARTKSVGPKFRVSLGKSEINLNRFFHSLTGYLLLLIVGLYFFRLPLFSQAEGPMQLIEEADRLAWLNNWVKAGPLYERAETFFGQAEDERNALDARIGK